MINALPFLSNIIEEHMFTTTNKILTLKSTIIKEKHKLRKMLFDFKIILIDQHMLLFIVAYSWLMHDSTKSRTGSVCTETM